MQTNTLLTELKGLLNRLNRINIDMDDLLILTEIDNLISDYEAVNPPIKDVWDFVEQNLPDYYKSEEVAESNDLDKIIDNEYEEGDHADRLRQEIIEEIGTDDQFLIAQKAQQKLYEVNAYLFEESIKNFLKID